VVEFKREWPSDAYKTARQIASHAIALRGEEAIWIIGVDEKNGVVGASVTEFALWWSTIAAHFIEITPESTVVSISLNCGHSVTAIAFSTDQGPYLIKNPSFGTEGGVKIASEVPWRSGTRTETATRNQLLSLLMPATARPGFEILRATVVADPRENPMVKCRADILLYIEPRSPRVGFPFHRIAGEITGAGSPIALEKLQFAREMPNTWPKDVFATVMLDELVLEGPAMMRLSGEFVGPFRTPPIPNLELHIRFETLHHEHSLSLHFSLEP